MGPGTCDKSVATLSDVTVVTLDLTLYSPQEWSSLALPR
jgi:hypothetical protein